MALTGKAGVPFRPAADDSPVQWAVQMGCFDMVPALEALGFPYPEVEAHWVAAHDEYQAWRQGG